MPSPNERSVGDDDGDDFPSEREVSPAEQLCRSSRFVSPRFRLVVAEFLPESLLMIFSRRKTPYSQRWASEVHQGAHVAGGAPYPPGHAPCLVGPLVALRCPSFAICSLSSRKNHKQAFGTRLCHHEAEPWRIQSRAPAELFCRGNFPLGGEIIAIVITNAPLIGRGQSPSTSSSAPSHLKTLVHLLYPIFVPKPQLGTCGLLVVLITPCS